MMLRVLSTKFFCLYLLLGLGWQLHGVTHSIAMARLASITSQTKIASDKPQIQPSASPALNPESTAAQPKPGLLNRCCIRARAFLDRFNCGEQRVRLVDSSTPIAWSTFSSDIDKFASVMRTQLHTQGAWVGGYKPDQKRFDMQQPAAFKPYVQKLEVPAGSNVAVFGDLHAESESFNDSLRDLQKQGLLDKDFKVCQKDGKPTYLMFLGDYVDRGKSGVPVMQTLFNLKRANPDNVFMVRGNHEDIDINVRDGFMAELSSRFGKSADVNKVARVYDLLPVALYLACKDAKSGITNNVQCCHGGMETGYNPRELFQFDSKQPYAFENMEEWWQRCDAYHKLSKDQQAAIKNAGLPFGNRLDRDEPAGMKNSGFVWNDFIVDHGKTPIRYKRGRGWAFGKSLTDAVLDQASTSEHKLCGVFRAHQHNGRMLEHLCCDHNKGCVQLWQPGKTDESAQAGVGQLPLKQRLWNGIVCTFLSTPVARTNFPYHAYGVVKTADKFEDWQLSMHSNPVTP